MSARPCPVIVLTGGPGGGKTTALRELRFPLEGRGFTVYTLPEMATLLFSNGVEPERAAALGHSAEYSFRRELVRAQIQLEDQLRAMVALLHPTPAHGRPVIVQDRGIFDDFPYAHGGWLVHDRMHAELGLSRAAAYQRYDRVIHLTSTAIGVPHLYSVASNDQRRENVDAAARADELTLAGWGGHPDRHIVPNRARDGSAVSWPMKLLQVQDLILTRLGPPGD